MNLLKFNTSGLNEVIFDKRNKNYGAYQIRTQYNQTILKSLMGLSSLIVLLFVSNYTYHKFNTIPNKEAPLLFDDPKIDVFERVTEVNITPPTPEVIPQTQQAAVAPTNNIPTRIVDHAIEPEPTLNINPSAGITTPNSTLTGVGGNGTETPGITTISGKAEMPKETTEVNWAEEMPEYEGGVAGLMNYIRQNLMYPPEAREIDIQGTVYVSFLVNEIGNVEGVKIMKGIGYGCDEEVFRVISKMPKWKKAGRNANHPVKVRYNMPVAFKLK
jgi:periplasmic protein TonB